MENACIAVKKMTDRVYLLDDRGQSTGFLVVGTKKALMIDTMCGGEDLEALARRYTELPLMLVNTHGHPDHIIGNHYFEEAYMHPLDMDAAREFMEHPKYLEKVAEQGRKPAKLLPITDGTVIDLGDCHLDVIHFVGHTPGSIFLLLREERILFTGDAINTHTWMQLPESACPELFLESLRNVMWLTEKADRILHGHTTEFLDIDLMKKTELALEEIIARKTDGEQVYHWFGGEDRTHPIPGTDGGVICFKPYKKEVEETRKQWAASDAARDAGLTEPETILAHRNISYGPYGPANLLDVYVLKDGAENKARRLPVIVNIHGGGYFYGDKELYRFYCMHLAEFGFAVVNFNYRLAPEYRFPGPIQDINGVLCWIEQNAAEYGLDTEHVFLIGDSAGAQLASQYGAINTNPDYRKAFFMPEHGIRIKGLSLACGLYDIPKMRDSEAHGGIFSDYFGDERMVPKGDPRVDVLAAITADYPPAFVFSCPNDFLVTECEPMADYINQTGGKATARIFGTKDNLECGHVFHCNLYLEEGKEANAAQAAFFMSLIK